MIKSLADELYYDQKYVIDVKFIESIQQDTMTEVIRYITIPVEHILMSIKIVYAVKMNGI